MTSLSVPVGVWHIDPMHSSVEFSARHMMVARVRGRFNRFEGTLSVSEDGAKARVLANIEIDVASVDTGNEKRDGDLRSSNFLDADRHPFLQFTLDEAVLIDDLERDAGGAYVFELPGELTVRGKTCAVVLHVAYEGTAVDHMGYKHLAFVATSRINRREWNITWNLAIADGVLIGDMVDILLEIDAVRDE